VGSYYDMSSNITPSSTRGAFVAGSIAAGLASSGAAVAAEQPIPHRKLGTTGESVSIVGVGGFHLGKPDLTQADATRIVHTALDAGVNFLDNCWDYNNGEGEVRLGNALAQGGYRSKAFLMTKLDGRDKQSAKSQLDDSLRRLKTDRIDLVQIHEVIRESDPERVFAPGGAIETLVAAREAGKIRFIGFTGHKSPEIHLKMLQVADVHHFRFDTVQMPLNVMDAHYDSFAKRVIPVAQSKHMGILAMKTFGDHHILDTHAVDPIDMLHYGMNLPVSVVITGIDTMEILAQALRSARTFKPLSDAQVAAILAKTQTLAQGGKYELYKTTHMFDGTYANPQWLG